MKIRFLPFLSGALVATCAPAPGSARVVAPHPASPASTAARSFPASVAGSRRTKSSTVNSCSGKAAPAAGPNSFVGVAAGLNFAGDAPTENPTAVTQFAGVVAGTGNLACSSYTGILAGENNGVGGGDFFDFLAYASVIGGGSGNSIGVASYAIVGAGTANSIAGGGSGYNADTSAILAGSSNYVEGVGSFIGAGSNNAVKNTYAGSGPESISAFIGAGDGNTLVGTDSVITGGSLNTIGLKGNGGNGINAHHAALGGGYKNNVTASYGTIGGGDGNTVTGVAATVGGGYANTAGGQNAAIPGGAYNVASGTDSFAAGTRSNAATAGTFVWSDDSAGATTLASTAPNEFLARAAGGFALYSSANLRSGVRLAPGSGSWSSLSDRASKTAVESVDDARILAQVAALPVSEWSYSAQGAGVRHLGPMAQDFRAAFGLGEDDRHIAAVDEEGVALAAIKALQAQNAAQDRQLTALRSRLGRLETRLHALEDAQR